MNGMLLRISALISLVLLASCGDSDPQPDTGTFTLDPGDTSLVVMGPSLVELFFDSGEGWRISGVDRYSLWPPEVRDLPEVGGYIDASFESIAALDPTSLHTVGESPELEEIARELGIPYYGYTFDTLADVYSAMDRIETIYGSPAGEFRERLSGTLDSLRTDLGGVSRSVLLIIYHQPGAGTMTLAGRNTFLEDLVRELGCSLAAPEYGTYPSISVEGVLDLSPDRIVCLYPDSPDTLASRELELEFWSGFGYGPPDVRVLFDDYLLVPGARMGLTAERIAECLR